MNLYIIDVISAINSLANLVFITFFLVLAYQMITKKSIPILKKGYMAVFLVSLLIIIFCPSKETLEIILK
jgi:hypothetical protein